MNLRLIRHENGYRPDGIFSSIFTDDDATTQVAITCEHSYGCEDPEVASSAPSYPGALFVPKIPPGEYECVRGAHRLHGMTEDFQTFEIVGVDGHHNLLFHWGNIEQDSEGCVLVGEREVEGDLRGLKHVEMVTNSRATFAKFMALQDGVDSFTLTVVA